MKVLRMTDLDLAGKTVMIRFDFELQLLEGSLSVRDLPDWLQEIILHCLEVHADERYATAADLAADLRRAFSGIVSGNVKEQGIRAIERHGPFELVGDPAIMAMLDELLSAFVAQQRMKLPGTAYVPCYRVVRP